MKKKLLFVIDSLGCAGAEKSLVTLLGLMDYSRFEVDLLLFAYGKELEELVPKEVNILPPLSYTKFSGLDFHQAMKNALLEKNFQLLLSRMKFSSVLRRRKYSNAEKARIYWQTVSSVIEENPKQYDVAISYAQGVPTFYTAEKVHAKRKLAWVNVSYRLSQKEIAFQTTYYHHYDKVIAVSESAKSIFQEIFPAYKDKTEVVYDINNPNFITNMASLSKGFKDEFGGLRIVTVARLANQKGYDIAIEACRKLKETGLDFRWYAIGDGPLREEVERLIRTNGLTDDFILLGSKANPYPYTKNADIYVQTSKFEGFGLAIAEARMLNIPVVTTRFDAVYSQMKNEKNGLVVDMNGGAVAEGILKLHNDKRLTERIIAYQKQEKKGNLEEMNKVYALIG